MLTTVLKIGKLLGMSVSGHLTKHLLVCEIIIEVLFDTVFTEKTARQHNKPASP